MQFCKTTSHRDVCSKLKLMVVFVMIAADAAAAAGILYRRSYSVNFAVVNALLSLSLYQPRSAVLFSAALSSVIPFSCVFLSFQFSFLHLYYYVYPASTSSMIHTLACSIFLCCFLSFFWLASVRHRSSVYIYECVCGIIYMPVLHKSTHISLSLYTHTHTYIHSNTYLCTHTHTYTPTLRFRSGYCLLLLL